MARQTIRNGTQSVRAHLRTRNGQHLAKASVSVGTFYDEYGQPHLQLRVGKFLLNLNLRDVPAVSDAMIDAMENDRNYQKGM